MSRGQSSKVGSLRLGKPNGLVSSPYRNLQTRAVLYNVYIPYQADCDTRVVFNPRWRPSSGRLGIRWKP